MLPHGHRDAALPARRRQPGPAALSPRGRLKDGDLAETAFRGRRFAYSGAGAVIGGFAGFMRGGLEAGLIGGLLGAALVYVLSGHVVTAAAASARAVLLPSGASTPYRHAFSQVDACILRQRYAEAAELLERHAMDAPNDPEAYIRLARLHRDHLGDPRRALEWFGHARATGALAPGLRRLIDDEAAACRARLVPPSPSKDA